MKKIFFFSNNKNKIKEINALFKNLSIEVLNLNNFPIIEEPEENGSSFENNAKIKSDFGFNNFNMPCFSDDSGICIKALENKPGIRSKAFIEENGGLEKTFDYIHKKTQLLKNYNAYFQTTISLTQSTNSTIFFNGVVEGKISSKPRGENGFGYDPIFIPEGNIKTFAEMMPEQKNKISHRSIAIKKLVDYLLQTFN